MQFGTYSINFIIMVGKLLEIDMWNRVIERWGWLNIRVKCFGGFSNANPKRSSVPFLLIVSKRYPSVVVVWRWRKPYLSLQSSYISTMKQLSLLLIPLVSSFQLQPKRMHFISRLYDSAWNKRPATAQHDPHQRAKECAEHFGQCSVDEIQQLRDGTYFRT